MRMGRNPSGGAHEAFPLGANAGPGRSLKQAVGETEDALSAWKGNVARARRDLEHSHREYQRRVTRAKKAIDQAGKPASNS
jgi:phage shock protein A